MRSAAQLPTSAAEPFKAAVTSVSGPDQGWRGGLERMPRKFDDAALRSGGLLSHESTRDSPFSRIVRSRMVEAHNL